MVKNDEVSWADFKPEYLKQYGIDSDGRPIPGFRPVPEDHAHANNFVRIVRDSPELVERLGRATLVRDDCMGGVFRTSLLVAPFADTTNPATRIELCDLEGPQLELARRGLANGLDGWQVHIDDLAEADVGGWWHDAVQTVLQFGVVVPRSIFSPAEQQSDVGTLAFGPESLTESLEECAAAFTSAVSSVKPGGVIVVHYMDGSNGWDGFPAVPVNGDIVEKMLRKGVRVIGHEFVPASGSIRKEGDPTHYRGIGLLVGIVEEP